MSSNRQFGLIGESLQHSFSPTYFKKKFEFEDIQDAAYNLYELKDINEFCKLVQKHDFSGLNVTIPFKETIMPYLDCISDEALSVGAVNTIRFSNGSLIGYNTDVVGARLSIEKMIQDRAIEQALILGTGGAAKAIRFVLEQLGIPYYNVSRSSGDYIYEDLDEYVISKSQLIINTTPLGMFPHVNHCPNIPYQFLTEKHLLFDLVYNPKITLFLKKGLENSSQIMNGEMMLVEQAEAAWGIWNND